MAKKIDPAAPLAKAERPESVDASVWKQVLETFPELKGRDIFAAEAFATTYMERLKLRAEVEERGSLAVGSQGQQVMSPSAKRLDAVDKLMLLYLKELGGTPASRGGKTAGGGKSKEEAFFT